VAGCTALIDPSKLMCRRHWNLVPGPIADSVWAQFLKAPQSEAHRAAMRLAIITVEDAVSRQNQK
jgi:hypothetical protein